MISLPIALLWTGFGAWAAWVNFDPNSIAIYGLIFCSLYLVLAGALQQVLPSVKNR
jgi:phosphatidylcholine synthase